MRFADTSEQRDMRVGASLVLYLWSLVLTSLGFQRQERVMNEGESPAKMSIAQAALINLYGGQSPSPQQHYSRLPPAVPIDDFQVVPRGMDRYGAPLPQAAHYRSVNPPQSYPRRPLPPISADPGFNQGMKAVLQSMQMLNYGGHHSEEYNYNKAVATYRALNDPSLPQDQPPRMQSGFTPVEERILRAHAGGAEGYSKSGRLTNLPPTSESDFHAAARGDSSSYDQQYSKLSSTPSDFAYSRTHDTGLHAINDSQNQNLSPAHLRSTTAPSSHSTQRSSSTTYNPRQHYSTISFPPGSNTTHNFTNKNSSSIRSNTYTGYQHNTIHNIDTNSAHSNFKQNSHRQATHAHNQNQKNMNYDFDNHHDNLHNIPDNAVDSPLVSPALTFSGRTPVTLSPSTPFFGSFAQAQDDFKGIREQLQDPERQCDGEVNIQGLMSGVQDKMNLSVPVTSRAHN